MASVLERLTDQVKHFSIHHMPTAHRHTKSYSNVYSTKPRSLLFFSHCYILCLAAEIWELAAAQKTCQLSVSRLVLHSKVRKKQVPNFRLVKMNCFGGSSISSTFLCSFFPKEQNGLGQWFSNFFYAVPPEKTLNSLSTTIRI